MSDAGGYTLQLGRPFAPAAPTWTYTAPEKKEFYSFFISGAQRLSNGNTLVCYGSKGTFFEVTPEGEEVWRFVNPAVGPEGSSVMEDERKPGNIVFRVHRYMADHPAFEDKDLTPGPVLTEYLKDQPVGMPLTLEAYTERNAMLTK